MRTLVTDDDLIARILLVDILSDFGVCDAAVDGEEAVRAYRLSLQRNKVYDLICLDIMMPKVDGIEALRRIRAIEEENGTPPDRRVKIIMVTALTDQVSEEQALMEKCDAYLVKPIEKDVLLDKLGELNLL